MERLCVIEDNENKSKNDSGEKNPTTGDQHSPLDAVQRKQPHYVLTGDLAVRGTDGHIFVCGRTDDRIKRFGKFVLLSRLCDVVECIPTVRRCVSRYCNESRVLFCFIQFDNDIGDCERFSLVKNIDNVEHAEIFDHKLAYEDVENIYGNSFTKDAILTKETIHKHIREHLSASYFPDVIRFVDYIPMTLNGKSDFKKLIAAATSKTRYSTHHFVPEPRKRQHEQQSHLHQPPQPLPQYQQRALQPLCKTHLLSQNSSSPPQVDSFKHHQISNQYSGLLTTNYLRECWCLALEIDEFSALQETEYSNDVNRERTFTELGGDSFSALLLLNRLADVEPSLIINDGGRGGELYETLFTEILGSNYEQFKALLWLQLGKFKTTTALISTKMQKITETMPPKVKETMSPTQQQQLETTLSTTTQITFTSTVDTYGTDITNPKSIETILNKYYIVFQARNRYQKCLPQYKEEFEQQIQIKLPHTINNDFIAVTDSSSIEFNKLVENRLKWNIRTNDLSRTFDSSPPPSCVNSITLNVVSKYSLGKCIDASPLVVFNKSNSNGLVLIGSHSHAFVALNLFSPLESLDVGRSFTKGRDIDGRINDDDVKWRVKTDDRIESSAALTEDGQYCVFGK